MKLRMISEGILMQQLRGFLNGTDRYFDRPFQQTANLYNPSRGFGSETQVGGATLYPTGMPTKPRHQRFLGLQNRLGIRL